MNTVESICADLGIKIAQCHEPPAMAAMLYERLAPIFDPPPKDAYKPDQRPDRQN